SDDRQRAVVPTVCQFCGRDGAFKLLRLLQHFDWEVMRQMVLADNNLDIHAEVVFVTQNLDNAPLWIVGRRWPRRNFDIDYHPFELFPLPAMRFLAVHAIPIVLLSRRVPRSIAHFWR